MHQSSTRYVGLDVHKEQRLPWPTSPKHTTPRSLNPAPIGTRQCDLDTLIRKLQANSKHLVFVYEAGPCGYSALSLPYQKRIRVLSHRPLLNSQKGRGPRENRPSGCHPARPADALRRSHPRLCARG